MSLLVDAKTPLAAADAVAAIIIADDRYLMQLRDMREDIWYPDHWGLFGGAIEAGEDSVAALKRELSEELELTVEPAAAQFFMKLEFDLAGLSLGRYRRDIFIVRISPDTVRRLVLHEGAAVRCFTAGEILSELRVTPYDSFAIFLHSARARLRQLS